MYELRTDLLQFLSVEFYNKRPKTQIVIVAEIFTKNNSKYTPSAHLDFGLPRAFCGRSSGHLIM
jgi:hypothetical protein